MFGLVVWVLCAWLIAYLLCCYTCVCCLVLSVLFVCGVCIGVFIVYYYLDFVCGFVVVVVYLSCLDTLFVFEFVYAVWCCLFVGVDVIVIFAVLIDFDLGF